MKTTSITFGRSETINLGNYNTAKIEISATAELEEGEKTEDVYAKLRDTVNSKIAHQAAERAKNGTYR